MKINIFKSIFLSATYLIIIFPQTGNAEETIFIGECERTYKLYAPTNPKVLS